MLDFLLAPAIIAGVIAFFLNAAREARRQLASEVAAASAVAVEVEMNGTALRKFIAGFEDLLWRRVREQPDYVPFLPVDERSTLIFEEHSERILMLDPDTVRAVASYVKADQALNGLLRQIGQQDFGEASETRRDEVMRELQKLCLQAAEFADAATRQLRHAAEKRKRRWLLIGYRWLH